MPKTLNGNGNGNGKIAPPPAQPEPQPEPQPETATETSKTYSFSSSEELGAYVDEYTQATYGIKIPTALEQAAAAAYWVLRSELPQLLAAQYKSTFGESYKWDNNMYTDCREKQIPGMFGTPDSPYASPEALVEWAKEHLAICNAEFAPIMRANLEILERQQRAVDAKRTPPPPPRNGNGVNLPPPPPRR